MNVVLKLSRSSITNMAQAAKTQLTRDLVVIKETIEPTVDGRFSVGFRKQIADAEQLIADIQEADNVELVD